MSSIDSPNVLVVDDESDVADLYRIWLEEAYAVRVAYDGETAIESLDATIDIVLLDRRMPGLSGDDVLAEIEARNLDCRVVMVTAVKPDFDVIEMGFDDYLVKPVSRDDLHEAVNRMRRRSTYDEQVQELFTLASKKAVLEAEKNPQALETNDEFVELEAELDAVRQQADGARADLRGHDDFVAAFHDL